MGDDIGGMIKTSSSTCMSREDERKDLQLLYLKQWQRKKERDAKQKTGKKARKKCEGDGYRSDLFDLRRSRQILPELLTGGVYVHGAVLSIHLLLCYTIHKSIET